MAMVNMGDESRHSLAKKSAMKVKFVSVENSILAVGFRKVVAVARSIHSDVGMYFVAPGNLYSKYTLLVKAGDITNDLPNEDVEIIAKDLAQADMVCFSCMTMISNLTKKLIAAIRIINPRVYIVWGGIHPIVDSADTIQCVDAICTGEGETAFRNFFLAYRNGEDYTKTKNFWFNVNGTIIQNDFLPLQSGEEMDKLPLTHYAKDEKIYRSGLGFCTMEQKDYLAFNGVIYTTVWSIGCPYHCNFCSNTKFIANDKHYSKLRHPSVDYLIREVKNAIKIHPYISSVAFQDDSFMAISSGSLQAFATKWKHEINLPFSVHGVIPAYVRRDKMAILLRGGMNWLRMGIQSGSDRILDFYRRPNKPGELAQAISIIGEFKDYMLPPTYDFILDNPLETRQDIIDTLEFLYKIPRPFTLNYFSLRVIPNSDMARDLAMLGITAEHIKTKSYKVLRPTFGNILFLMLATLRPPRWLFDFLLKYVKGYADQQAEYPILLYMFRILYLLRYACSHLWYMDFSFITGNLGWICSKTGAIKFWQKLVLRNPAGLVSQIQTAEIAGHGSPVDDRS